jgi:SAM-dependent methyltransferase
MKNSFNESWNSFSSSSAKEYLKGEGLGGGSKNSAIIVSDILKSFNLNNSSILELGCGNGQFLELLILNGIDSKFVGVDISTPLLDVAIKNSKLKNSIFIYDDVTNLDATKNLGIKFKVGIYSHVLEMLQSPHESLLNAKMICNIIIIRFFEPPIFKYDKVEMKEMLVDIQNNIYKPYLRRKMSKDYYKHILNDIGCSKVHVYNDEYSTDQIHVLYF